MIASVIALAFVILVGYIINTIIKPKNFPPGPRWYPFFGSSNVVHSLTKKHGSQFKALLELSKEYSTEILGLKLGSEQVVVVYGKKNVRQAFTDKAFEGRPDNFFLRLRCLGKRMGITFTDGELWRIHRQFTLTQLRNVGFGKTPMEKEIQNELLSVLDYLKKNNKPINPSSFVSQAVMNVLWKYVAGEKIKEEKWRYMQESFRQRSKAFSMAGGLLNQMPWCRFFIPHLSGYSLITKLNRQISDIIEFALATIDCQSALGLRCLTLRLIRRVHDLHLVENEYLFSELGCLLGEYHIVVGRTVAPVVCAPRKVPLGLNNQFHKELNRMTQEAIAKHKRKEIDGNDFIYSFMEEMAQNKDTFTEEQLKMVCLDLLIAGSQTTSNVLEFALLQVLRNKSIQENIQDEIDRVIGNNVPCWADNTKLVYTSAFLLELQRYYTIVPLAGPRRVLHDIVIDGHLIPKDTTVLISVGDIHFSSELWGDPHVFKPERFIDERGMLKYSEHMYPFGLGRRRCPGDSLAKSFVFLMFVGILQQYRIECSNGMLPSDEPILGLIASPKPYKADFVPRK